MALNLAIAALEDAGIPYFVKGERSLETYFGVESKCEIEVSSEVETEARELLEPLQNPDPALFDESKSE